MDATTYLNTHKFRPHSMGNYGLFGLNFFGSHSIISVKNIPGLENHIWKFVSFPGPSDYVATYINEEGAQYIFNFNDPKISDNITRLEEYNDKNDKNNN